MSYLIESEWSEATVGDVDLGDSRRTARAVQMLARMAENPGGKLSDVFKSAKERDAAYDFMESSRTRTCALAEAFARSTARASAALDRVIVPVDGTSTSLTDNTGKKGFGRIGADVSRGVGLKVINVIAVSADGVPVGLLDQSGGLDRRLRGAARRRSDTHAAKRRRRRRRSTTGAKPSSALRFT